MFFIKALQKKALGKLKTVREVIFMPVYNAKKVTIIYNTTEDGIGEAIDFLISLLDNKKIAYEGIAINTGKLPVEPASIKKGFSLIEKKDLDRIGLPVAEFKKPFGGKSADLLFDFAPEYNFTQDYIVRMCDASFKAGRINYDSNPFDFIAGGGSGKPLEFIEHTINYLTSIKPA